VVEVTGRDEDVGYPAQHELRQLILLHVAGRFQDAVQSGADAPLVLFRIGERSDGPCFADRQDVDRNADEFLIERRILDRDERRGRNAWYLVVQVDEVMFDAIERSTQQRLVVIAVAIPPCGPRQEHLLHGLLPGWTGGIRGVGPALDPRRIKALQLHDAGHDRMQLRGDPSIG
jgi:hypothetical protein